MGIDVTMGACVKDAVSMADLEDWGPKPDPVEGAPHQYGRSLIGGDEEAFEVGVWECTPGVYVLHIAADEFSHTVAGRWRLTHESGGEMELVAGDSLFLPGGWKGTVRVIETVRKVYSISR